MKASTILTTQELAKYLKLNEKTVIKMAQNKKLPGFKIGSQWRFYLSAIDEYLQDKITKSVNYDLRELIKNTDGVLPLSRLMEKGCVNLDLLSKKKDDVLCELAGLAYKAKVAVSLEELIKQLKKREKMLSTAVGGGVAIPHPRNPSDELFKRPGVIIARSVKGINFDSPDGKPVHLFFLTCAPDVVLHLNLLAKIAKLLEVENIFKEFMEAESDDDVVKLLLQIERIKIKGV